MEDLKNIKVKLYIELLEKLKKYHWDIKMKKDFCDKNKKLEEIYLLLKKRENVKNDLDKEIKNNLKAVNKNILKISKDIDKSNRRNSIKELENLMNKRKGLIKTEHIDDKILEVVEQCIINLLKTSQLKREERSNSFYFDKLNILIEKRVF